jgi:hypothetical protein
MAVVTATKRNDLGFLLFWTLVQVVLQTMEDKKTILKTTGFLFGFMVV